MRLVNEFSVGAAPDRAWQTLTDLPAVASCIPGAHIEEQIEGQLQGQLQDQDAGAAAPTYRGRVDLAVGPVKLGLVGQATVLERDDERRVLVVRGEARDSRGQGSAALTMTMRARERGGDATVTDVEVHTDLELGGRVAQFGAGVVNQVSGRLLKQFVARLDALIVGPTEPALAAVGGGSGATGAGVGPARPRPAYVGRPFRRADLAGAALVGAAGIVLGLALGRTLRRGSLT